MKIKILDITAILISLAVIAGFSVMVYANPKDQKQVVIEASGKQWVYPLDSEEEVEVPGPLGITRVHVHKGAVDIEDSPCKNKICVAAGDISEVGQWIACLPNNVIVRIEGEAEEGGVDAGSF